jgi:GH24 family phage-related lysozyme (muramidase)
MTENHEKLLVSSETFEPFVLCLALGTLEAMKAEIWSSEAGVWTIGRPNFLNELEKMKISDETIDVLVQFDELNALEKIAEKEDFQRELLKIERKIKKRLEEFSGVFWHAEWSDETS